MIKQVAWFILLTLFCGGVAAQNTGGNPALASFNAQRSGDHVIVTWTIRSGFSCASVNVLHSTDSINFTSVYEYPGICGSSAQDESYSFTQSTTSTGKNFYKLDMGTYGTSAVVLVNIFTYGTNGLVITGDHGSAHKVFFSNPVNTIFSMELFDATGKMIHSQQNIEGDRINLPPIPGTSGLIVLRLTGKDGTIYEGKYVN